MIFKVRLKGTFPEARSEREKMIAKRLEKKEEAGPTASCRGNQLMRIAPLESLS